MNKEGGAIALSALQDYTVVDLETTSNNPAFAKIIEAAAVRYRDGKETARFCARIKPKGKFNNESMEINGITEEMLKDAKGPEEVIPEFVRFVGNDVLMGYNINSYDRVVLKRYFSKYAGTEIQNETVDVLSIDKKLYPGGKIGHKLTDAASRLGIDTEGAHCALTDCLICSAVFYKLLAQIEQDPNLKEALEKKTGTQKKISEYKANSTENGEDGPLNGVKVVITGELHGYSKGDAWQLVLDKGGDVTKKVSGKTDILVVADEKRQRGEVTDNERLAIEQIEKGGKIKILSEKEFFELLGI
ncbi:MAG: hypothetical protein E7321_05400 [Clostridiales bacterium]|nr:hypothetical protein [Clostridiales bacterium]